MPHYLIETAAAGDAHVSSAIELTARRFPEVTVECRYVPHHADGSQIWVCRAPSEAHVVRWADRARLAPSRTIQVEVALNPTRPRPSSSPDTERVRPERSPR